MTSFVTRAQVGKNRALLAKLNGTTAPAAYPAPVLVTIGQTNGQIAEIFQSKRGDR